MSDDAQKPQDPDTPKEPVADNLNEVKSAEIDSSDAKVLKKRLKKAPPGTDPLLIEIARIQEKNLPKVEPLMEEFDLKMRELGYALIAKLKFTPQGIWPEWDIRPMTSEEFAKHQVYKATMAQKKKDEAAKLAGAQQSEADDAQAKPEAPIEAPVEPPAPESPQA